MPDDTNKDNTNPRNQPQGFPRTRPAYVTPVSRVESTPEAPLDQPSVQATALSDADTSNTTPQTSGMGATTPLGSQSTLPQPDASHAISTGAHHDIEGGTSQSNSDNVHSSTGEVSQQNMATTAVPAVAPQPVSHQLAEKPVSMQSSATAPASPELTTRPINDISAAGSMPGQASQSTMAPSNNHTAPMAMAGGAMAGAHAVSTQNTATTSYATPPKKKRKKLVLVGIILAALLALFAGGWAAYALWYQNPDRVLSHALLNASQYKTGKVDVTIGDIEMPSGSMPNGMAFERVEMQIAMGNGTGNIEIGAKMVMSLNGTEIKIGGTGRFVEGKVAYFKIDDMNETLEMMKNDRNFSMVVNIYGEKNLKALLTTLSEDWIKLDIDQLKKDGNKSAESFLCTMEAASDPEVQKKSQERALEGFKKHKFLSIAKELGVKDGKRGYELAFDKEQYKKYAEATKDDEYEKKMQSCLSADAATTREKEASSSSDFEMKSTEVWVTNLGHDIVSFKTDLVSEVVDGTSKMTMTMNFKEMGEPMVVEAPETSMPLDEWQKKVDEKMKAIISSTRLGLRGGGALDGESSYYQQGTTPSQEVY